jgi:hypothetical protein
MTKMLSQANRTLLWVPEGGIDDPEHPTVAELNDAGVLDLSCLVTKANFSLGATGDESINDPAYCASGNSVAPGNTNYEAAMEFFRWTTTPEDEAWNTFTDKGIAGSFVERIGKPYDDPIVATDKVKVVGVITGTPRDLNPDGSGGYEKFHLDSFVQSELTELRAVVAA